MLNQQKLFKALVSIKDDITFLAEDELKHAAHAWQNLEDSEELRSQLKKTQFLMPTWHGDLKGKKAIPPKGHFSYKILAVDGSQIYPDRHEGIDCALVNIGGLYIGYQENDSSIDFFSDPYVYRARYNEGHELSADIIDCHRHELELKTALHKALFYKKTKGESPVVLFDGSLIFWHLEGKPRLKKMYFDRYCALLKQFYEYRIILICYISLPKSKELINILRVCDEHSYQTITDADLMMNILKPYERTISFANHAPITHEYPAMMEPLFFYLHTGDEVARVEVPRWVSEDKKLVVFIEMILVDQVKKGSGYPIMIAEAHECAVVKQHEKHLFFSMLEQVGALSRQKSFKLRKKQRPAA